MVLSLVPALLVAWLGTAQAVVFGHNLSSVPSYLATIVWEVVGLRGLLE